MHEILAQVFVDNFKVAKKRTLLILVRFLASIILHEMMPIDCKANS
jgi:hypothetical protein